MKNNPPFAVLFDMDGVLLDSVEASMYSRRQVANLFGFTPDEMMQHSEPGRSLRDFYDTLQKVRPFTASFKEFSDHVLEAVFAYLKEHVTGGEPALMHFLDELQARHIPIALGTSAIKRSALRKLELAGLGGRFEVMVTADDATRHKPHPEIYQKAANNLGIPPEKCIVIEDAASGIKAGHAAGMKVIGFSKFVKNLDALQQADLVVADFSELSYEKLSQLVSGQRV